MNVDPEGRDMIDPEGRGTIDPEGRGTVNPEGRDAVDARAHPGHLGPLLDQLRFDAAGLVTAVAQQHDTGEVLMLAHMNRAAVERTVATGDVTYWSRSRGALWRKGETSGQVQRLVELRVDCDGDALLLLVEQTGVACHTGRRTCFHRVWRDETLRTVGPVETAPATLYRGT